MKNHVVVVSLFCLLISSYGCKSKSKHSEAPTGSSYLSTSEIEGTSYSSCMQAPGILGTAYSSMSLQYSLTINSNETLNYQLTFYDSANCATGTEGYSFTQSGTLTSDGPSSTINGATNFSITLSSAFITPENSSWLTKLNTYCSYNSFALNTSKDVSGVSCTSNDALMSAISWPVSGTVLYNSGKLTTGTSNILRINVSNSDTYSVYKPGGAGYPATLTTDFTY